MEPTQTPNNYEQSQPEKSDSDIKQSNIGKTLKNNVVSWVLIVAVTLLIIALMGSLYYIKDQIDSKNNEIFTLNTEVAQLKEDIDKANLKVTQLDNPTQKKNDEKRKGDLENFINSVDEYKKTSGNYPTTEPSLFTKEFGNLYLDKISDFSDPNTKQTYEIIPVATVQTPPGLTLGTIQYQWPGECLGSEFGDTDKLSKAAARILLESGETYCKNI